MLIASFWYMTAIDAALEFIGDDDIDVDFKVGGKKVVGIRAKDKTIDVTIFDAKACKDLMGRAKKCRS